MASMMSSRKDVPNGIVVSAMSSGTPIPFAAFMFVGIVAALENPIVSGTVAIFGSKETLKNDTQYTLNAKSGVAGNGFSRRTSEETGTFTFKTPAITGVNVQLGEIDGQFGFVTDEMPEGKFLRQLKDRGAFIRML